jgi:ABC-type transport system involved in Fe-S cluster assembly fused permease/ATPase subunit
VEICQCPLRIQLCGRLAIERAGRLDTIDLDEYGAGAIADEAAGRANAWIKGLRHVDVAGRTLRDRFHYRGDSLWWFAELFLHKEGVVDTLWRTALTLDAVCEVEQPTRVGVVDGGPAVRLLLPQVAARLGIYLLPGTDVGRGAAAARNTATGVKSRLLTWAAEARRALPIGRPALATGGTLAFVHSAFWRDATGEEGYIAPILDALAGTGAAPIQLVGVGPRHNFQARRWWDPLTPGWRRPRADGAIVAVEALASRAALAGSRAVWQARHDVSAALTGSAALRAAAPIAGYDAWALIAPELQGIATLKMFGRSAEQVGNIRTISRQYGDTTMEVLRTAFQTSLVLEWGGAVAVALVAVEISLRLMAGAIEFDRALAVLIIVPEFFLPLRTLATRYHAGAAGRTAAASAFAILDEPITMRPSTPTATPTTRDVPLAADIVFVGVGVTYPDRTEPALRGLDLTIPHGRVVALVGPTGAGKTTVANLLLRFLEPDAGEIRVGDRPLDSIDVAAWRASVAWVPQLPYLFDGSVADNIRLARPEAGDDVVRDAIQAAGADGFIAALPRGLDTPVGEGGARLSGGQRQRIAIARAVLADARLVILDEATSQLDPASEAIIAETIRGMTPRRTVLVVSHRLRLVAEADDVIVLDRGRVVEAGPPELLLEQDGPYRALVAAGRSDPDVVR